MSLSIQAVQMCPTCPVQSLWISQSQDKPPLRCLSQVWARACPSSVLLPKYRASGGLLECHQGSVIWDPKSTQTPKENWALTSTQFSWELFSRVVQGREVGGGVLAVEERTEMVRWKSKSRTVGTDQHQKTQGREAYLYQQWSRSCFCFLMLLPCGHKEEL